MKTGLEILKNPGKGEIVTHFIPNGEIKED